MANLAELAQFDSVYQIETTDLVQGGPSGVTNAPLKNLTNRTLWLKQQSTFKSLLRGVVSPYLEIAGSANLNVNKASDLYGKIVPIYHNDPGSVSTATITLLTSDMTPDDYGTVVRFTVSTAGIEGVEVQIKVGSTVIGVLNSGTGYSVEVFFNGTTWELNSNTMFTPAGQVAAYAMSAAPQGWLKCNGAAISRSTYSNLFKAIGTTFGVGDGSTTFNLPDLRGEFIRGFDDGRGVDNSSIALVCNTTNGSSAVTVQDGTSGLFVGMAVTGTGIPANTTITAIGSRTSITLSANATATNTGTTLTFSRTRTFGSTQADMIRRHEHFSAALANALNSTSPTTQTTIDWDGATFAQRYNYNGEYFGGAETRPRNVAMLYCIKF